MNPVDFRSPFEQKRSASARRASERKRTWLTVVGMLVACFIALGLAIAGIVVAVHDGRPLAWAVGIACFVCSLVALIALCRMEIRSNPKSECLTESSEMWMAKMMGVPQPSAETQHPVTEQPRPVPETANLLTMQSYYHLDDLPDAAMVLDREGRTVAVGSRLARFVGKQKLDLVGLSWLTFILDEDVVHACDMLRHSGADGACRFQVQCVSESGYVRCEWSVALKTDGGYLITIRPEPPRTAGSTQTVSALADETYDKAIAKRRR
jgi:hypothetical protein